MLSQNANEKVSFIFKPAAALKDRSVLITPTSFVCKTLAAKSFNSTRKIQHSGLCGSAAVAAAGK